MASGTRKETLRREDNPSWEPRPCEIVLLGSLPGCHACIQPADVHKLHSQRLKGADAWTVSAPGFCGQVGNEDVSRLNQTLRISITYYSL